MKRLLLVFIASLSLVLPLTVQAAADVPSGAGYRKAWILCSSQDGFIDIGGAVWLKEPQGPDSHVTRFKVKWLLYTTPDPTPTTLAYRRATVTSNYFPDDNRSFTWTTPRQRWDDLAAPDEGFMLVAKLTWERAGRRDWNHRFPFVRCS